MPRAVGIAMSTELLAAAIGVPHGVQIQCVSQSAEDVAAGVVRLYLTGNLPTPYEFALPGQPLVQWLYPPPGALSHEAIAAALARTLGLPASPSPLRVSGISLAELRRLFGDPRSGRQLDLAVADAGVDAATASDLASSPPP